MKKTLYISKLIFTAVFIIIATSFVRRPEYKPRKIIKLGFIALTDCATLIIAKEMGFFQKYGVEVQVTKEASWAIIRDKLLNGELDGAHCLFSMPFSVYEGIGGKAGSEMRIAMCLNNNGQAITLSKDFCGLVGFKETKKVAGAVKTLQSRKEITFAMTFPGGTHDIWLRNWLAACGINSKSVGIITIPPPQMVANMRVDNMEGFCVGEPWNGVAATQGIGFTHIATQDIWKHHPEKALVVNKAFSEASREDLKNVMKAILEACKWLDVMSNRKKAASIISKPNYINAPASVLEARLMGSTDIGCDLGVQKYKDDYMLYYNNGLVNAPRKAHGIWFLSQYARFGMIPAMPADYKEIADRIIMDDLYAEVAKSMAITVPGDDMKPFKTNLESVVFDPNNPKAYIALAAK
jgi:nitrate/nitrite transport system substrate-binding protein